VPAFVVLAYAAGLADVPAVALSVSSFALAAIVGAVALEAAPAGANDDRGVMLVGLAGKGSLFR